MARQLDNLSDAVVSAPGNVIDTEGFTEQIRSDAPHLLGRWMRLSEERDTLMASVTRVRLLVGEYAGDATAVDAVAREVEGVLTTVRRYQERTTDVLLDAYERDLGGE